MKVGGTVNAWASSLNELETSQTNGRAKTQPSATSAAYLVTSPGIRRQAPRRTGRAVARIPSGRPAPTAASAPGVLIREPSPEDPLVVDPPPRQADGQHGEREEDDEEDPRHGRGVAHLQVLPAVL